MAKAVFEVRIKHDPLTIKGIQEKVHQTATDKGWWDEESDHNIAQKLLLITSEISEAHEEIRNGHALDEIYFQGEKPEGVAVELADAIIRILDLCAEKNIPIHEALILKSDYNNTRPYRHGGKIA